MYTATNSASFFLDVLIKTIIKAKSFIVTAAVMLFATAACNAGTIVFDGIPNDGQDDWPKLQTALANMSNGDTLKFAAGTYDIMMDCSGQPYCPIIGLRSAKNRTFEGAVNGNGTPSTTIMIHNLDATFVRAVYGENITVKNFEIRRNPWPFSQGLVKSVGSSSIVVEAQAGFPSFQAPQFVNGKFPVNSYVGGNFVQQGAWRRIKPMTASHYHIQEIEAGTGANRFNVKFKNNINNVSVGDGFILRNRIGGTIINAYYARKITVENIVAAESPNILVFGRHASDVTVHNLKTKYYAGQWTAGNGDGINLGSTRDGNDQDNIAVDISDVNIQGLGDDMVNLHSQRMLAVSGSGNSLRISNAQYNAQVGDQIVVFRTGTGTVIGEATITAIQTHSNSNDRTFTLSTALSGSVVTGDHVYNETTANRNFQIKNSFFRHGSRNALVLRANGGYVYNNDIRDMGGRGVDTNSSWAQAHSPSTGLRLKDTLIYNNHFKATSLSDMVNTGAIFIRTPNAAGGVASSKMNVGNVIRGNRFTSYQGTVMTLHSLGGTTLIEDNILDTTTSSFIRPNNYLFRLQNVSGITMRNNDFDGDFRNHTGCFDLSPAPSSTSYTLAAGNSWPAGISCY